MSDDLKSALLPDVVYLLSKAIDEVNTTASDSLSDNIVTLNSYGEQIIELMQQFEAKGKVVSLRPTGTVKKKTLGSSKSKTKSKAKAKTTKRRR